MTAIRSPKGIRAATVAEVEGWATRALERAAFLEFDGGHSRAVANRCAAGETLAALIDERADTALKSLAGAVLAALGLTTPSGDGETSNSQEG